jgi:hypothetical protein
MDQIKRWKQYFVLQRDFLKIGNTIYAYRYRRSKGQINVLFSVLYSSFAETFRKWRLQEFCGRKFRMARQKRVTYSSSKLEKRKPYFWKTLKIYSTTVCCFYFSTTQTQNKLNTAICKCCELQMSKNISIISH